ncbi:MAG: response regulator [Sphingomonas sp.]|uniref:response regulator n=1 Tax=Sphingomonas sp. TaxID=28214 RepID=UPI001AC18DCD|nr:response regulator [Sphingomonas sp.]MBN8808264.1 response regulator [Sphingomonas sp.]
MRLQMLEPLLATNGKRPPAPAIAPGRSSDEATRLETRVLIVEDEMMIAWMIESLLSDAGFENVAIAADGKEACRQASEQTPGLVVSDINLGSGINGVEAAVAICHAGRIPVLFVTAYADGATRERIAAHFPHAELLRKPVDGASLTAAVHRALEFRHGN